MRDRAADRARRRRHRRRPSTVIRMFPLLCHGATIRPSAAPHEGIAVRMRLERGKEAVHLRRARDGLILRCEVAACLRSRLLSGESAGPEPLRGTRAAVGRRAQGSSRGRGRCLRHVPARLPALVCSGRVGTDRIGWHVRATPSSGSRTRAEPRRPLSSFSSAPFQSSSAIATRASTSQASACRLGSAVDKADCKKRSASRRALRRFPDASDASLSPSSACMRQYQWRKNLGVCFGSSTLAKLRDASSYLPSSSAAYPVAIPPMHREGPRQ